MNRLLLLVRSNWISATGAIVTTVAFMLFVTTFVYLSLHGGLHGAYMGLFAFIALPLAFVSGLALIPVGLVLYRKQLQDRLAVAAQRPFRLMRVIGVLTLVNLAVAGTGGFEATHYLDSQEFCGTLCHEVMSPTYEAYLDSPHSRIACVDCHVGPGATWFLKAKLNGVRQLVGVITGDHARPIPTPVHGLRPAADTCERCHNPQPAGPDQLVWRHKFAEDETSTRTTNALLLKLGGVKPDGTATGIHAHAHGGGKVEYVSVEDKRQVIPWIRHTDANGKVRIYTKDDVEADKPPTGELRTMDCTDCHNQPSHHFRELDRELDGALADERLPTGLPFFRKVAAETLKMEWARDTAPAAIQSHLEQHYGAVAGLSDEQKALVGPAASQLAKIWLRNVYPDMKITWGTYPSFTGHVGCMRCHDGEHLDDGGTPISADCTTCHDVLAQDAVNPAILELVQRKKAN